MPRFFINTEQIDEDKVTLTGADAHHIARSLRMAVGETVTVCDTQAIEYECEIIGFDDDRQVFAKIISSKKSQAEPPMNITLYQALSKGDKLDTVIQKAVECGVSRIVPFESERCVVKVKPEAEDRKTERRCKIAAEAAKQCGRGLLPEVFDTVDFNQMLELASDAGLGIFCYEGEDTQLLGKILDEYLVPDEDGKYPNVAIVVGSEGGFSKQEADAARACGLMCVGLGKRILRTETAPIFAISCVICKAELS